MLLKVVEAWNFSVIPLNSKFSRVMLAFYRTDFDAVASSEVSFLFRSDLYSIECGSIVADFVIVVSGMRYDYSQHFVGQFYSEMLQHLNELDCC